MSEIASSQVESEVPCRRSTHPQAFSRKCMDHLSTKNLGRDGRIQHDRNGQTSRVHELPSPVIHARYYLRATSSNVPAVSVMETTEAPVASAARTCVHQLTTLRSGVVPTPSTVNLGLPASPGAKRNRETRRLRDDQLHQCVPKSIEDVPIVRGTRQRHIPQFSNRCRIDIGRL